MPFTNKKLLLLAKSTVYCWIRGVIASGMVVLLSEK
jgi:hypothetical protein